LTEVSALIGVLAEALGDAIDVSEPAAGAHRQVSAHTVLSTIRSWLRPKLAQVTELRLVKTPRDDAGSE
jgi:hypothetical protein